MFCSRCGTEIPAQSRFCPNCGQPVNPTVTRSAAPNNTGVYTLTINRENQWFAVNPPVNIVIDQNTQYQLENGATIRIPIAAGMHNIAFSASIRNKVLNINVAGNVTLNMRWNRITGSLVVKEGA